MEALIKRYPRKIKRAENDHSRRADMAQLISRGGLFGCSVGGLCSTAPEKAIKKPLPITGVLQGWLYSISYLYSQFLTGNIPNNLLNTPYGLSQILSSSTSSFTSPCAFLPYFSSFQSRGSLLLIATRVFDGI